MLTPNPPSCPVEKRRRAVKRFINENPFLPSPTGEPDEAELASLEEAGPHALEVAEEEDSPPKAGCQKAERVGSVRSWEHGVTR